MITDKGTEKFIDYITGEDNDLLFGGLEKDAPAEAKKAYEEFVERYKEREQSGIKLWQNV